MHRKRYAGKSDRQKKRVKSICNTDEPDLQWGKHKSVQLLQLLSFSFIFKQI